MKIVRRRMRKFTVLLPMCFSIVLFCGATEGAAQTVAQQAPATKGPILDPLAAFPKDRILRPIENRSTVTLHGHVHPRTKSALDGGSVAGDVRMTGMILVLKRDADQQEALDSLSQAQEDPSSPLFHKWLTPESFGTHFGVSQNDLNRVASWLKSEGFTVDDLPAGHWTIVFSGTVAQVETAFNVAMRRYQIGADLYYANSTDPSIPEALAGVVQGVAGMNNFPPKPASGKITSHIVDAAGDHFIEPSDFAAIYDLNPLYANGVRGSGVNIAVIEPCDASVEVIPAAQAFWSLEGLSGQEAGYVDYAVGTTQPQACSSTSSTSGDISEAVLDYEWAGAAAPGASVVLISSAQNSIYAAVMDVVNDGWTGNGGPVTFPQVITVSYSDCESTADQVWVTLWQQAHTAGITGVVSAGDDGAAGCDNPNTETVATEGLAINGLCASAYVVCVGGTQFNDVANPATYWSSAGKAIGYIPEVAWNESGANGGSGLWASGGGYSTFNPKPAWQTGNSSSYRGVPDVALTAAGHDGYRVCPTASGCSNSPGSEIYVESGTSAAAPSFAAIVALLVQQAGPQGNVNQTMYALAASNLYQIVFHDVTQGSNTVPGQTGYSAAPGWDPVTGLGSVDANALVSHWTAGPAANPTVSLSSTSLSFGSQAVGSSSAVQMVTVSNTGGAGLAISSLTLSGTNSTDFPSTNNCGSSISANASCTINVSFKPTANGTRTASIVINDNAANSPQSIALTGTGAATPAVSLSTSSVSFGSQSVGSSSAVQNVVVSNTGAAALTVASFSVSGTNTTDFLVTNNCSGSFASGAFCTISISFKPTATGTRTASLTINDNAVGSPQTIGLTGTAIASTSPTASTYHVFPQVADGYYAGGYYYQSTLIVTNSNPSISNLSCTLQFHGLTIAGQSQMSFSVGSIYTYLTPGNTQALQTGYASLQCSSNVEAQLLYSLYTGTGTKISEATVFSSPSATWLRIFGDERGGAQLALAIANDSAENGSYTVDIYNSNGALIGTPTLTVNANSSRAFYIDSLTTAPSNNWGIVDIIANSGSASVIGLSFNGSLFTTIPATVMSSPSPTASTNLVFPQIADGSSGGFYYQSTLIVTNSSPATSIPSCTLQFHGLTIGGQSQMSFSVTGIYSYLTPGNTQALQTGYASLQCSSNVDAQILYSLYTSTGTRISEATVFSSPSATWLRILGDQRSGAQIALAIANNSNLSGRYTVNIYNNSGVLIGAPTLTVGANSSSAFYIDNLITVPGNNWGAVDIIANSGTASVIGLNFSGSLFTTVPAAEMP